MLMSSWGDTDGAVWIVTPPLVFCTWSQQSCVKERVGKSDANGHIFQKKCFPTKHLVFLKHLNLSAKPGVYCMLMCVFKFIQKKRLCLGYLKINCKNVWKKRQREVKRAVKQKYFIGLGIFFPSAHFYPKKILFASSLPPSFLFPHPLQNCSFYEASVTNHSSPQVSLVCFCSFFLCPFLPPSKPFSSCSLF